MKPFVNNKTEFSTKQILQEVGLRDTDGQFGSAIINFVPGLHSVFGILSLLCLTLRVIPIETDDIFCICFSFIYLFENCGCDCK